MTSLVWTLSAALVVAVAWCFRLHRRLRAAESERDEWIEKAQRYFRSADLGSLGMNTGLGGINFADTGQLQAQTGRLEEIARIADWQSRMMGVCHHGVTRYLCPLCPKPEDP